MNFDIDDPLESDDSFFEEPKTFGKKTSSAKSNAKSIENLFGPIEKELKTESSTDILDIPLRTKHVVTFEDNAIKTVSGVSLAPRPKDNWLVDSESKVVESHTAKKNDFFEDILSARPKSLAPANKLASLDDILKDSKATSKRTEKGLPTKRQVESNIGFSNISQERRRPRKGSTIGIEDTLGLFEEENSKKDVSKSAEDIKSNAKYDTDFRKRMASKHVLKLSSIHEFLDDDNKIIKKDIPNWLGGSLPILNSNDGVQESTVTNEKFQSTPEKMEQTSREVTATEVNLKHSSDRLNPQNIAMELQNSYSSLHQQESFLLFSIQLKKYEEMLAEIKNQQKIIVDKQQDQFKTLIDEYILKQQMNENNIRLQQERINNQIQMMITDSFNPKYPLKGEGDNPIQKDSSEFFDNLVANLKERHKEELFILEESYKKQINMLEKSNENLETKLKEEIGCIRDILEDKVTAIKEKYEDEVSYFKEKIKNLENEHVEEINLLKEKHTEVIQEMKLDHSVQLEYIKKMKQYETELLDKSKSFSDQIGTSVEILNQNTKTLQEIEEKVVHKYDVTTALRENLIQNKEKEIMMMRNTLEKCRQSAEEERTQLFTLIKSLETKLSERSCNAREDRWALQQATATFTSRATALEREAEFNRNSIEREREQLKTLKESLLAEQEKMVMQLTEEKLQLASEKARIEVCGKLTNDYEIEKIKFEAETAIQVAKELSEKVSAERSYLFKQKKEIECLQRSLTERERELADKEIELEYLMKEAQKKFNQDKRVLTETKMMENMYKERLHELKQLQTSVTNREKKLAEEKVLLSKERLSLYSSNKSRKGCVLCKSDKRNPAIFDLSDIYTRGSEAEIYRLKADLEEEERESEVSKEENISIQNNDNVK